MTTRKYDAKKTTREERKNAVLKNGVKRVPTKKTLPKRVPLSQENKVKTVLDESKKVHERRERGRLAMASRLGVSTLYTNALERAANGSLSTAPNKASPSRAVVSPTVLPNLSVRAKLASDALFGVGIGPVMFAVQRGWAIAKPTYPLAAINFIGNILLAACLNQTPPVSELPRWLAVVYQALIPKVVTHGNLRVAYSWETDATLENFSIGSTYSNGPSGMSFHLNFGVVQTTDMTNTTFFDYAGAYPIANTVYNPVEGPNAWADLLKFLSDLFPGNRMHEKVSPTKPNKFTNDASAFAISTANPGGSMANTGAPGSRKSLETPLATPMLSVFTPIVSSVSVTNRCPKWSVLSGGGPVELGLLLFTINNNAIRKLVQPKFKFVDFYRTADKIIRSAVLAVQRRLDSDEAKLIQLVNSNEIEAQIKRIVPQMTLQDCLYIIRNEMMTALGDTQVFCQTLFPDAQAQNGIVPFTCTIGTCPLGKTNQMLLPSLLAEEIKSYTSRLIDVPNHDPASKYPKELDFYIGVLSQINGYGLSENDYYVSVLNPNRGTTPDKYPFFLKSPNAAEEKPKMPSSPSIFAKKPKIDADVNISLVDGSGGTTFYAINTPDFLNPRIEAWNKFIGDFSDIFEKTVKVGKDGGVVTSLGKTDYITVATSDMKMPRKKYGENNNNGVFYGYGSNLSVISTSYRDQPIEVVEQGLPFSAPIAFLSSGAQNDEVIANLSSLNGEYLSTVKSATPTTVLVSENTLDSVNLCVMTKDGVPNSTTTGLEQLSKEGGGGIFAEALGILGNVGGGIIDSFI